MLTNHCYSDIENNWDTERHPKNKVYDCCFQPNPDDPTCEDCCYDTWDQKLKEVNQSYKKASEVAGLVKKKLDLALDRRSRYRLWLSELEKADDITRLICHQLEVIVSQSGKLWYNSCKAVEAIQILFCMIKDFYKQIDYLQKRYDELQVCLNNNRDSALEKGKGILKYVDEYAQKLKLILNTRDEIIVSDMQAIKLSNLIRNNISTQNCPCPDPKDPYDPCKDGDAPCPPCDDKHRFYGFKTIICEWHNDFKCDEPCVEIDPCAEEESTPQQQQQSYDKKSGGSNQGNTPEQTPKPDDWCTLKPIINFPICNDGYKKKLMDWLADDESNVKKWADDYKKQIKEREALQACKDSLVKAIDAVNPRERCK